MPLTCWTLTTGEAGHQSQVLGLAEAMGFDDPHNLVVNIAFPWLGLPTALAGLLPIAAVRSLDFRPPWPDLIIACGRRAALAALAVKRASGGQTRLIQIMDPRGQHAAFDLIVVPAHDPYRGANVLVMDGAPHRVNPARLAAGAADLSARVAALPRPLIGVLIGGSNDDYRLDIKWARHFGETLARISRARGLGLMITASRRTGLDQIRALRDALASTNAFVWDPWDGPGDNPYFGLLGLADVLMVTEESVSMLSEACSTGKGVYAIHVPSLRTSKFSDLHKRLLDGKFIRWFDGDLEPWSAPKLVDMAEVGTAARTKLGL